MNIPDPFKFHSHLKYLAYLIQMNSEPRGFQSQFCAKISCQPASFSRAMHGAINFTRDQIANMCSVLKFDEQQIEYFFCIYDAEVSSSDFLRRRSLEKAKKMQKEYLELSLQLRQSSKYLDSEIAFEYYSSWKYAAVYIFLLIPEQVKNIQMIQKHLKLAPEELLVIINKLLKWGFVQRTPEGYRGIEKSLHLEKKHPASIQDHVNWRLKAIENIQREKEQDIHYSAVFSISKKDAEEIKSMIVDHLKMQRALISNSKSELVYSCNLDFFGLSEN